MSNRRSFLRTLALAPVAAKDAAAKMSIGAATSAASDASGLMAGLAPGASSYGAPMVAAPWQSDIDRVMRWKAFGLPSWKQREIKHNARHQARVLDPDIAALRSLSPSAAYTLQRARIESTMLDRELDSLRAWMEQSLEGQS